MTAFSFDDLAFMAAAAAANDPFFSNVSLLLKGDGANNSTSIIDSSASPKTIVVNGSAKISTTQSVFGGASLSFVRTPQSYLTVSNASGSFTFGSGDFTIEAWVYLTSLPTGNGYPNSYWILGGGPPANNPGFDIAIGSTTLQVGLTTFASLNINATHGLSIDTWYHIAVCRSGGSLYAFRDGTQIGSATFSPSLVVEPMSTGIAISAAEPPPGVTDGNFNGFMDDLRITKGVARYTANFTRPTAPFPDF